MKTVAAFAGRDFLVLRSYRFALASDFGWGVVNLLVYFFISRLIGLPVEDLGAAAGYFEFVVAGIVASLVLGAVTTETSDRIREEELTGTLEIVVAQPVRAELLALGYAAFPVMFALVRVLLYLVIAITFLDFDAASADWIGVGAVLLASAAGFLALGIVAAAVTIVFKRGGRVADLAVFAMTFLGGALFPISTFPSWLEPLGRMMPTRFAFDGLREALFAGEGWLNDVAVLGGVAAVALPLSLWIFDRAVESQARRLAGAILGSRYEPSTPARGCRLPARRRGPRTRPAEDERNLRPERDRRAFLGAARRGEAAGRDRGGDAGRVRRRA